MRSTGSPMSAERKDIHNSDIPVLCRSCEARHGGVCAVLEPDQLLAFARATRKARHEPGQELLGESAEVQTYANVMRGVVKLSKVLEDGRQQLVGLQFAPDFLGRLYGETSEVTAEAASEVELCIVPRATLEQLVGRNPALERRLMVQTLRELDEARDWMLTLGRKTAQERVASFLYLLATHLDPAAAEARSTAFDLPLTRFDIADFLGLTVETVSRQLTRLKRMGAIVIANTRHIEVPDVGRLKALCG